MNRRQMQWDYLLSISSIFNQARCHCMAKGAVVPVRNQGDRTTCVAHSTSDCISAWEVHEGVSYPAVPLSTQQCLDGVYDRHRHRLDANGNYTVEHYEVYDFSRFEGLVPAIKYPYTARRGRYRPPLGYRTFIRGYDYMGNRRTAAIAVLRRGVPVTAGIQLYKSFYKWNSLDIYHPLPHERPLLFKHLMQIVAYGVGGWLNGVYDADAEYFVAKNSEGEDFCAFGFIWIHISLFHDFGRPIGVHRRQVHQAGRLSLSYRSRRIN